MTVVGRQIGTVKPLGMLELVFVERYRIAAVQITEKAEQREEDGGHGWLR